MFGYMTFNMKYYILSQIFYKKIGCDTDYSPAEIVFWVLGSCKGP